VRFLSMAVFLVLGLAGTASAQGYNNTPGTYTDIRVGVVPAMLPPGSLPGDTPLLGPDLYVGTLVITNSGGGFSATYQGERSDGAKLNIGATFTSSWLGFKISTVLVGTSMEPIIAGIDGGALLTANINGVGTVDGHNHRVIAKVSAGPTVTQFKVLKAPGNLR
jgi:hypothetical protein